MACHPSSEEALPKAPTPVRVRVVEERSLQAASRYSGSIEPGTRVDLAFKVGGYIQDHRWQVITLLMVPVLYAIFVFDLKLVKWELRDDSLGPAAGERG